MKDAKANSQKYMQEVYEARKKKNGQGTKKVKRYRTGFERANHIPLKQPISNFNDGSRILF